MNEKDIESKESDDYHRGRYNGFKDGYNQATELFQKELARLNRPINETKKEFEDSYIENSSISKEDYDEYFVTLPCKCGNKCCSGWTCVNNDELSIKTHNNLYD